MAQCNINKNDHNLDSIIEMLTDLRETLKEVIRINKENIRMVSLSHLPISARD